MANTFYNDACNIDAKMTPYPVPLKPIELDEGLTFYIAADDKDGQLLAPHSIMNDNVAINYRTIYNGYPMYGEKNFTEYSDYERCVNSDDFYANYLRDKRNPSYKNIITYYSSNEIDPHGLARYKMQDFIYLKYYNQIPNNYMITLRRYTRPCNDHMFGLDMGAAAANEMNGYEESYAALATAVTYMGEKTGNKLSDILKFDYGANWEEKEGKVESLQNPDGGLAAQMKERGRVSVSAEPQKIGGQNSTTAQLRGLLKFSAMVQGKGKSIQEALKSQYAYNDDAFARRYGEEFYGDVNVVNRVKMRSRGLTFSNSFSLTFEYSLKSLKCVNPRVAMMDIISNFLILTGNYGTFWGGATIFYGQRNIAPQYGDPDLLRKGDYKGYVQSVLGDVKEGFMKLTGRDADGDKGLFKSLWDGIKSIGSGAIQGLIGNILGGNIGVVGQAQVPAALLSGEPSGFWHVTIGNPLDPIAMMGNMAVTKTTVQFNDVLGYDDFPTEVKFTVELEHCMPRDNAKIESMFNAGKGRFYSFTDGDILKKYQSVDSLKNFDISSDTMLNQERNVEYDTSNAMPFGKIKTLGGFLNG